MQMIKMLLKSSLILSAYIVLNIFNLVATNSIVINRSFKVALDNVYSSKIYSRKIKSNKCTLLLNTNTLGNYTNKIHMHQYQDY